MATFEKYVTFLVNDILFGVSVTKVQEVLRSQEITDVPLSLTAVPGVINLRGQIIPARTCAGAWVWRETRTRKS